MRHLAAFLFSCMLVAVWCGGLDDTYLSKVDLDSNSTLEHLYRCKTARSIHVPRSKLITLFYLQTWP
jgi:hypothetical protein